MLETVSKAIEDTFGGKLHGVIASLGSWYGGGNLEELSNETWERAIAGRLTAHFNLAKATLPFLNQVNQPTYTFVNGGAALGPVPNSGVVSIVAAAQQMMKEVIHSEHKLSPLRVNSLLLTSLIATRARPKSHMTGLSAEDVGKYLLFLSDSSSEEIKGQTIQFGNKEDLPSEVRK